MKFEQITCTSIEKVVESYVKNKTDDIYIIVVGANEGCIDDFVTSHFNNPKVKALLVEPVKCLFENLKKKFQNNKNLCFENSALYKRNGKKHFFRIEADEKMPAWTKGLGSFYKDVILSHDNQVRTLGNRLAKEVVDCITLSDLLRKHKLVFVDILQIDVEGYDYEIIMRIDLKALRPRMIIFEYMHLTYYQYYRVIEFFENNNYTVRRNDFFFDMIAISNEAMFDIPECQYRDKL